MLGVAVIMSCSPNNGKLAEWLRQQVANLSFSNGCIGSIPILSAKQCGYDVMVACVLAKDSVRVRFSLPAPNNMVDSIGMRRGLIIPGDWSDRLERQGSNPWSTTKQHGSVCRLASNQEKANGYMQVRPLSDPPDYSSVVKWYNPRLIIVNYKFNSCRSYQV